MKALTVFSLISCARAALVVTESANTANSGPQICFRMKVAIGILFLPPPNQ